VQAQRGRFTQSKQLGQRLAVLRQADLVGVVVGAAFDQHKHFWLSRSLKKLAPQRRRTMRSPAPCTTSRGESAWATFFTDRSASKEHSKKRVAIFSK
jgi:hypothetical protein